MSAEQKTKKDISLPLHKLLNESNIVAIKERFEREDGRSMDREQLREALNQIAEVDYLDDRQYDIIFKKMDATCSGIVTWDEFISYLILGFEQEEVSLEFKTLDPPIPSLPLTVKTNHRHGVNRITFFPTVKVDRSTSWNDGSIITSCMDGSINFWSLDMMLERRAHSTCPNLKIQTTWVTDTAVLPDVSVICTSSSERDLRFYDTSARKFELRVIVSYFPHAILNMHYTFDKDVTVPSKLVCGDSGGNVRVLFLDSEARGPFRSQPGIPRRETRYEKVLRGAVPGMTLIDINDVHTDFVRDVYYYSQLHSVVSCSQCNKALQITDITDISKFYSFKVLGGIWSIAVSEENHLVASGGPDCLVRLWNPFVTGRPICTFYGHHTGIVQMVFQDNGEKLYSLSKDKCIKVWDVGLQDILQTYLDLPSNLIADRLSVATLYNPESRQWIIGSNIFAILALDPKQNAEHTDGSTHTSGVSVVLYNKLFQSVVSCGLDSFIIVWDPWDGRRLLVIKDAHTVLVHGEILPVEITAATFDPGWQRLITGAHDGTLKVWNFNTGTCLRNLKIETWCEVQSVIWVKGRIMAFGWNKRVTEFADTNESDSPGGAFCKNWDLRHVEDISSGVVRVPETLVTSSYSGELIFWRLETGQPYKKFNVSHPKDRIKLFYQAKSKDQKSPEDQVVTVKKLSLAQIRKQSKGEPTGTGPSKRSSALQLFSSSRFRKVSNVSMPLEITLQKKLAVHSTFFLNARKTGDVNTGTLVVSLENGNIQIWNHMAAGELIDTFSAIHKAGDYVISMTSDEENEFLFVGTTVGYIKTWLLKNYCVPEEEKVHICMPAYRLKFPFMWGDRLLGRAQRMSRTQAFPILLNSFKGHYMPVSGLIYIDSSEIIISCSADYTCRMWSVGGRYIQTLGTFKPWKPLKPDIPLNSNSDLFTIPPDINRVASSTTLRVLMGGSFPKRLTIKQLIKLREKETVHVDNEKIYGSNLPDPILGQHYSLPERTIITKDIVFDTSFLYVPVYQHLITPAPIPINCDKRSSPKQTYE